MEPRGSIGNAVKLGALQPTGDRLGGEAELGGGLFGGEAAGGEGASLLLRSRGTGGAALHASRDTRVGTASGDEPIDPTSKRASVDRKSARDLGE